MSSTYAQYLARVRDQSRQCEQIYAARFGESAALLLAQRWRAAVSEEPLDWRTLSAIREEVKATTVHIDDVALFTFSTQVVEDCVSLRRLELES